MSAAIDLYHHLATVQDPTVDRAAAAALPTADAAALRRLIPMLLRRQDAEGTTGIVLSFHRLPTELKQQVVGEVAVLFRALREAAGRRSGHGPYNAMTIIRLSLEARLAYLVSDQLRHNDQAVREQAGECLYDMAGRAQPDPAERALPAVRADAAVYLNTALQHGVRTYGAHRQTAVLLAAARMLPRGRGELDAAVGDPRSAAGPALAQLLEDPEHLELCQAIPHWLGTETLGSAAERGLARCRTPQRLEALLRAHPFLLLSPARSAVGRVKHADPLWPSAETLRAMRPVSQRGLALWATILPFENERRVQCLAELAEAPDPLARLGAVRRLMALAESADAGDDTARRTAHEAIATFARDPEATVARVAVRYLKGVAWPGLTQLLTQLVNSPHADVKQMAVDYLAPLGFARLWDLWPRLEEKRRMAAAQALIKIDPRFHRFFASKLEQKDREARLQAIEMLRKLGQTSYYEQELASFAQGSDEYLASAAVRALGELRSEHSAEAIEQALGHEDTRVRANAVEAVAQQQAAPDHAQTLLEMAEQEENRPRANAIAALMEHRTSEAMGALTQMLGDERPEHRRSALWLVESGGLMALGRQVAQMAAADPDPEIKQRAGAVARKLVRTIASERRAG